MRRRSSPPQVGRPSRRRDAATKSWPTPRLRPRGSATRRNSAPSASAALRAAPRWLPSRGRSAAGSLGIPPGRLVRPRGCRGGEGPPGLHRAADALLERPFSDQGDKGGLRLLVVPALEGRLERAKLVAA